MSTLTEKRISVTSSPHVDWSNRNVFADRNLPVESESPFAGKRYCRNRMSNYELLR